MDSIQPGYDFLAGGGDMGARIRAMDWAQTPLGPVDGWPQSLRSALSILLPSRAQIALFWGGELVTLYNDAYRPVFGAKHPAALGKPIREAWDELWRSGLKELFDGVLTTGEAFWARDMPFFMERHGYLEETYFDVSYDPVRDESGRVGGLFCIVSETTGRVVGERRLRALRDLGGIAQRVTGVPEVYRAAAEVLRTCTEDIPFALLYAVDDESRSERLAGQSGLDAGSRAVANELPARDGPGWALASELRILDAQALVPFGALHSGPWPEPIETVAIVPFALPGEPSQGRLVAGISPRRRVDEDYRDFLRLVAANIAAAVAAARRSEDERRRARMLAELDRAKTAFFSNVSHEFRTPLTLMLSPLDDVLSDRQQPLAEVQRERLELARRSGLRLQKLVNALLDFSRIEAGRAKASYVATDLAAFTTEIAASFRSAIEKAGLTLTVACCALPAPAFVDREMWEKIVLNLISNAFKFTFEGGIEVRLGQAGNTIELTVHDTGIGIPATELPHVFERFWRVEGARSRTHEGTGIGLALVQELVGLHGGTVHVESDAGHGSTFTVAVPAGQAHLPAERIGAAPALFPAPVDAEAFVEEALRWLPDAADGGGADTMHAAPRADGAATRPHVLLADDNADMRGYVRRLLSARYDVEAVADGEAALAVIRARRPDLVLADVMMPRLDGLGLVRALRADPALRDIPVMLLSARAGQEARIEGADAGADDYLEKPFTASELAARVSARIEITRLRNAAEASVRARETQLRFITDHVPVLIVQCDAETRFTFVNAAYTARFDLHPREVVGRKIEDVVGTPAYQSLRHHVEAVLAGQRVEFEERVPYAGIGPRWMHCVYEPQLDADGTVSGFVGVLQDVHARRETEDALRASEGRFRTLADAAPALIWFTDPDGIVRYVNKRCNDFIETSLEEFAERGWAELLHADDRAGYVDAFLDAVRARGPFRARTRIRRLDGAWRWIDSHALPLIDDQGNFLGHVGISPDITEGVAHEEALRDSDRRKDEFIATLSHELRNPLAPLRNALQLLRLTGAGDAATVPIHAMMERQVNHLVRLVDDLLEMSRINRGVLELRRERVELEAVVRNAAETSKPLIDEAGHTLEIRLPDGPLWLEGDPVRLAQILANLLNNAARYTARHGRIDVQAEARDGWVAVTVRDNGVGFNPETGSRLFEMFSRGEGSSGLGIGLALARRLIEMHGGSIAASSPGPGLGATFTVRLPLATDQATPAPRESRSAVALPRQRILVVDDNRDAADSMRMILEHLGAEVRVARDGREAIDAFGRYDPAVVLLDIGMPGMDGYAVARAMRERFPARQATIVGLTGWGQEDDRRRGREAGFDHHLVKPADLAALQALLTKLHSPKADAPHVQ
ncbi:MAG: ATP-binding protein [Casimicrobiaceae bacterium]